MHRFKPLAVITVPNLEMVLKRYPKSLEVLLKPILLCLIQGLEEEDIQEYLEADTCGGILSKGCFHRYFHSDCTHCEEHAFIERLIHGYITAVRLTFYRYRFTDMLKETLMNKHDHNSLEIERLADTIVFYGY